MTAITIDKDKAIELLEKQVEKKGEDYVYTDEYDICLYFASGEAHNKVTGKYPNDSAPLCIVGHVYADLGLSVDDLYYDSPYYGTRNDQNGSVGYDNVYPDRDKVVLTEEASKVLLEAQGRQDNGGTWGEALAHAKAVTGA